MAAVAPQMANSANLTRFSLKAKRKNGLARGFYMLSSLSLSSGDVSSPCEILAAIINERDKNPTIVGIRGSGIKVSKSAVECI